MTSDFDSGMKKLGELLEAVERICPADSIEPVRDLVRTLLEVHRAGLAELLEVVREGTPDADALMQRLATRPSLASLFLLHDLHPDALGERIRQAIALASDAVGPGAHAEWVRTDAQGVHVRIESEKPAAAALLRRALEQTFGERVPDAVLHVDGGEDVPDKSLVPAERLIARRSAAE